MKTSTITPKEIQKEWFVVDASGQKLGRLATQIAHVLRGKHKPSFVPHLDCGDNIVVINCAKLDISEKKQSSKLYYHHSGYVGGIKSVSAGELLKNKPEALIEKAVKGMLPKNKLSRDVLKNLRVFADSEHNLKAQSPKPLPMSRMAK